MPKHPNVIQFSLDQEIRGELEKLKLPGESSLGITAKRLMLSALVPKTDELPMMTYKDLQSRLEAIEEQALQEQIDRLSNALEESMDWMIEMRETLSKVLSRLSEIEDALKQAPARSRSTKRDSSGRFIAKGEKDAQT